MADLPPVIITKTHPGPVRTLYLYHLKSESIGLSQKVSPMPLPEHAAEEAILMKMEGNTRLMSFGFVASHLTATPTPDSNGEYPIEDRSSYVKEVLVRTPSQFRKFARDFENIGILGRFEVKYPAEGNSGDPDYVEEDVYEGIVTDVNLERSVQSPLAYSIGLKFVHGDVAAIQSGRGAP